MKAGKDASGALKKAGESLLGAARMRLVTASQRPRVRSSASKAGNSHRKMQRRWL
jgi:hypothetical protein